MTISAPTVLIVSDFTADTLAQLLEHDGQEPAVTPRVGGFGRAIASNNRESK